jgi:diacylglycerol kinase (ATP)
MSSEPTRPEPATGDRTPRRVAVVFNPASGHQPLARREQGIRAGFEREGVELTWLPTTVEDAGAGLAAEAVQAGVDLVAVSGGDGTVRAAAAGLAGSAVPMAVLPGGTGNLLALNLRIPTRLDHAIEVALHGQRRRMDLGVTDHGVGGTSHFLIMAGMGFDAAMLGGTDPVLKRRLGSLAYARSGLHELHYPQDVYTITLDGRSSVRRRASAVLLANLGRITGDIALVRDALSDDGLLHVAVVRARSPLDWIQVASRVLFRGRWGDVRVEVFSARRVEIRSEVPHLFQHDGDVGQALDRLVAEVVPGALTICVPEPHQRAVHHQSAAARPRVGR